MSNINIPNLSKRIDSHVNTTATKLTSIDSKFTTLNLEQVIVKSANYDDYFSNSQNGTPPNKDLMFSTKAIVQMSDSSLMAMKNVILGAGYGYVIDNSYVPPVIVPIYADPPSHKDGSIVDTAPIDTSNTIGHFGTVVTPDEKADTVIDDGIVTEQTIQDSIDKYIPPTPSNLKEYLILGGIGIVSLIIVFEVIKLNNKKK